MRSQANDAGSISRQEAVSMVPPLFMDVQPHHAVRAQERRGGYPELLKREFVGLVWGWSANPENVLHIPVSEWNDSSHLVRDFHS